MFSYLPGLLQALIAGVFLVYAFRAHETYWTFGFIGWRKVYAGLALYLTGGLLNLWFEWSQSGSVGLSVLGAGAGILTSALGVAGIGLVLWGAVERLRDQAAERRRLESIRAGFDLFDTLRQVAAGPYAYLEVLDFSLKEMVRATDVATGGLWLYSPRSRDWVLTGAANMSQGFRQQTENVKGSGTGFDRLARLHKAHVFTQPEEIRLFFPEWEAEGYRAVLGLPLVTASAGQPEKRLLGVVILADTDPLAFDEDRVRRLHAAADFVAAVVAEAKLNRELDSQKRRAEEDLIAAERRIDEVRAEQKRLSAEWESKRDDMTRRWQDERQSLVEQHQRHLTEIEQAHADERQVWDDKKQALINRHEEAVAALKAAHDDDRRKWDEHARDTAAKFADEITALNMAHTQDRKAWEERSRADVAMHRAEMEKLKAAYDEDRQGWSAKAETQTARHAEETAALRDEHERRIAELKSGYQSRLATLDGQLAAVTRERDDMTASQEREAEQHAQEKARWEDRLTGMEEASARARSDYEARESSLKAQLQRLEEDLDRLHHELNDQHRLAEERVKALRARLDDERAVAAQAATQHEDDIAALREQFVQKEAVWIADRDEERRQAADREASYEQMLAAEREGRAAAERDKLEIERASADAIAAMEDSLERARAEQGEQIERMREERSSERAENRERVRVLTDRLNAAHKSMRDAASCLRENNVLGAAMSRFLPRLPSGTEVYVWRRLPGGGSELVTGQNRSGAISSLETHRPLPWDFELDTIPAEGPSTVDDPLHWGAMESRHATDHKTIWDQIWGVGRRPRWAVCWPWGGAGGPGENGWVTAFGFGESVPAAVRIEGLTTFVEVLGALVLRGQSQPAKEPAMSAARVTELELSKADEAIPPVEEPEEESPAGTLLDEDSSDDDIAESVPAFDEHAGIQSELIAADGDEDVDEDDFAALVEPEVAVSPTPAMNLTINGLHDVVISWVADQDGDAYRLELSASDVPFVTEEWLVGVLNLCRRSCRKNGGESSDEFLLATETDERRTILRLVNTDVLSQVDPDGPAYEIDEDLRGDEYVEASDRPFIGRWLKSGERRFGLELIFEDEGAVPDGAVVDWDAGKAEGGDALRVLVADDDPAMCDLIVGMLETLGHTVTGSVEPHIAYQYFESQPFDLAVVNADMSERAGIGLVEWIKSNAPHIPVLLLTEEGCDDPSYQGVADCLLRRPFRLDELQECLEVLMPEMREAESALAPMSDDDDGEEIDDF